MSIEVIEGAVRKNGKSYPIGSKLTFDTIEEERLVRIGAAKYLEEPKVDLASFQNLTPEERLLTEVYEQPEEGPVTSIPVEVVKKISKKVKSRR